MLPAKPHPALLALAILATIPPGESPAQQPTARAKPSRPATVAEAAGTLDLATFPLMPGAVAPGIRRLAQLDYAARGNCREAFAFQKQALEKLGWTEQPGGYLSDESCSGAFGKDGFTVSVSTNPAYGPDAAGMVDIHLAHLGNVDLGSLPVPPGAKPFYAFPAVAAYVTETAAPETAESLRALLTAQGWEPYGRAGDSRFFKQNAVRLTATSAVAPAQGGKTVIQLSTELMSVDLPAPPDLLDAAYADTTKALSLQVDRTPEDLVAFYKEALGKAGWKATTDRPLKDDFREVMLFRNAAEDILTLKMHESEGTLRASLEHRTAAEFAEARRLAEANESKRKAESAQAAKRAARQAAMDRVAVAIAVPAGAKNVARAKDRVEFQLAAGTARAAVLAIRADLAAKGWKGDAKGLDPLGGGTILSRKPGVSLAITYIDAGFGDAQVTISAIGADIEGPGTD